MVFFGSQVSMLRAQYFAGRAVPRETQEHIRHLADKAMEGSRIASQLDAHTFLAELNQGDGFVRCGVW